MDNYNLNYGAGSGTPWGMDAHGGADNQDFYAQQFQNLLSEQQGFKNEQIARAIRSEQTPGEPQEMGDPWAWANQGRGLPNVGVTDQSGYDYRLKSGITPGETTNAEILRLYGPDTQRADKWLNPDESGWKTSTEWSYATNPQDLLNTLGQSNLAPHNQEYFEGLYRNMFTGGSETPEGGGPTAAPGYASPVGTY